MWRVGKDTRGGTWYPSKLASFSEIVPWLLDANTQGTKSDGNYKYLVDFQQVVNIEKQYKTEGIEMKPATNGASILFLELPGFKDVLRLLLGSLTGRTG
eukprot:2982265-Amphidinium_carterae.2